MQLLPVLRSEFSSTIVSSCTPWFCICTVNNPDLTSQITWQREMRVILCGSKVNLCKHLVSSEILPYPKYTAIRAVLKAEYIAQELKCKDEVDSMLELIPLGT